MQVDKIYLNSPKLTVFKLVIKIWGILNSIDAVVKMMMTGQDDYQIA